MLLSFHLDHPTVTVRQSGTMIAIEWAPEDYGTPFCLILTPDDLKNLDMAITYYLGEQTHAHVTARAIAEEQESSRDHGEPHA
jgi:hypothetical protein